MLCSHHSVLIKSGIERVYRFVAVDFFDNYQKWSPEVCELEKISSGDMRVGVTGRQVRCDHGYRTEAYFRVTGMKPLRELRFASLSEPKFRVCYLFEPAADATRLTFEFQLKPTLMMLPFLGRIERVVEQDGCQIVTNLRKLVESEAGTVAAGAAHDHIAG